MSSETALRRPRTGPLCEADRPVIKAMLATGSSLEQIAAYAGSTPGRVAVFIEGPELASSMATSKGIPWVTLARWVVMIPAGVLAFLAAVKLGEFAIWLFMPSNPTRFDMVWSVALLSAVYPASFLWAAISVAPCAKHIIAIILSIPVIAYVAYVTYVNLSIGSLPWWLGVIGCVSSVISTICSAFMSATAND